MPPVVPHTRSFDWPALAPVSGRFAHRLIDATPVAGAVALLGVPDDTGVCLNGGRPGAAAGPAAFRSALARLGAAEPAGAPWPAVWDAGDVEPAGSLHATHARVSAAVGALLEAGMVPVVIGGGHDASFAAVRPLAERHGPRLAGVYFDAHLDVRPQDGSGMAFRRLVQDCGVSELHLHGFRTMVNTREHLAWFIGHGGRVHRDRSPVMLPIAPNELFVSFDLDVLDMAFAPGVSAANPSGWTPHNAEEWVHACGADPRVHYFDLMELCPAHDEGGRTARLAAHLFLTFVAARGAAQEGLRS
jgi:formiminoglutamase